MSAWTSLPDRMPALAVMQGIPQPEWVFMVHVMARTFRFLVVWKLPGILAQD